jgi:DNA helicase HerA-like ATPase
MTWNEQSITQLGIAYDRHGGKPFGIKLPDRLMHLYVIGQTGTGKSTLLRNLAVQDYAQGHGFCLIDPHGDLAAELSQQLDVEHIYWDVGDPINPYGYNPLTRPVARYRPLVASGLIETLKRQWSDAWGARMEHLLRYAILALLESPEADLRDIIRLYTDKPFRYEVVSRVADEQVRYFWMTEYPSMNYQSTADGVSSIANKLGALLAHPIVRRALCEPKKPLRFRRLMDDGRCLIISLAKGQIGADIANVIGGLLVSSLMNAAFTRHNVPPEDRRPFFLYVDEFHSFTTTAFASMMSEARKYGLGVTLAHQNIVQADKEVYEAVMGNVGSLMPFRVGANDAPDIARQLSRISPEDLMSLPNHHAYMQLMVDGHKRPPFSISTNP